MLWSIWKSYNNSINIYICWMKYSQIYVGFGVINWFWVSIHVFALLDKGIRPCQKWWSQTILRIKISGNQLKGSTHIKKCGVFSFGFGGEGFFVLWHSHQVPNAFPNMFPIASHFFPHASAKIELSYMNK
jgi:hypothetical protein